MKINLLLLSRLLKIKKNRKKYLRIINLGLFLSFFAITSALITFYTETKIDKLEFELLETHETKEEFSELTKYFIETRGVFYNYVNLEKNLNNFSEYIGGSNLGDKIFTVRDIYLPILYIDFEGGDFVYIEEFFEKGGLLDESEIAAKEFYNDKNHENLKDILSTSKRIREYENFFDKDYSIYHEDIFIYDTYKIFENPFDETINYYDSEIYNDYLKIFRLYGHLQDYFNAMSYFIQDIEILTDLTISMSNEAIKKLSERERNMIITAFVFQLFIFFIIQFFEVASIQNEGRLNAKRKIK
tara:strand:- start:1357 stop:2256 length:900 start_codon:yes stop_codon:yes gene_type:complete